MFETNAQDMKDKIDRLTPAEPSPAPETTELHVIKITALSDDVFDEDGRDSDWHYGVYDAVRVDYDATQAVQTQLAGNHNPYTDAEACKAAHLNRWTGSLFGWAESLQVDRYYWAKVTGTDPDSGQQIYTVVAPLW